MISGRTRLLSVALCGAVALVLASGCSVEADPDAVDPGSSVEDPTESQPSEEPVDPEPAFDYPLTAFTDTYASSEGYQQTLTLNLGPVMTAGDPSLSDAWASVASADTPIPCESTVSQLGANTVGYAFGTVAITNDTPDFDAKPWMWFFYGGTLFGVAYSDGAQCDQSTVGGSANIRPSWNGAPCLSSSWSPTT